MEKIRRMKEIVIFSSELFIFFVFANIFGY